MKRRNFLKQSALISAGVGTLSANDSLSGDKKKPQAEYIKTIPPKSIVDKLENKYLQVLINSDASIEIKDKINNASWNTFSIAQQDNGRIEENNVWTRGVRTLMEQYPAHFILEKKGSKYKVTLLNRQNRIKGNFYCEITLDKEWLKFNILKIDDQIPSLVYPAPIVSDAILIPQHIGQMISKDRADIWYRRFLPFYTDLNMNFIGGLKDDAAGIGIYE